MCGISGILRFDDSAPPITRERIDAMVERMHHRGPDERGVYTDEHVGLGHARLSIIDLSGGRQPIHNEDKSVWVVFNGEIYNYIELREQLVADGHSFYTSSDTEVLVHLYEQHGDAMVDHLNGQFGIAIWDTRARRLLLARDRLGIRPLYVTRVGQQLCFASEIKSLFALPEVERRLDPRRLAELFTYWSALEPGTVFAGVDQVRPGELRVYEGGERRVCRRYWDWSFPDVGPDPADTPPDGGVARGDEDARALADQSAELRELLVDAMKLRLRADVPVGAYLSGGLDSSVITALVHHFGGVPLRTFSLSFASAEHDEREHQQRLVEHLDTEHSEVRVTTRDIGEAFQRAVLHAEVPMLRTAPTPLMLLSQLVREQGYKVVLTGEGADEVFAGYDIFREAALRRLWLADPEGEAAQNLASRLYPYLDQSPLSSPIYAKKFFGQGAEHVKDPFYGHIPRWKTSGRARRFMSDDFAAAALEGFDPLEALRSTLPDDIGRWRPLCREQYIEAHTLMAGYLLSTQGDRVMMANSIEGRFPFLDHRVVELAAKLPPRSKLHVAADGGWDEKHILKRATADLLPQAIVKRPKQPYRAPDSQSFFDEQGKPLEFVAELLAPTRVADAGYFHPERVDKLVAKCRKGRAIGFADNQAFVGVLSTMIVDELIIRQAPSAPSAG